MKSLSLFSICLFSFYVSVFAHSFSVVGLQNNNEGIFAYNLRGINTGHLIPAPYNNFGNDTAYYYLASANFGGHLSAATTGMHGVSITNGFPTFSAALNSAGKSIADVNVRFEETNLTNDIQGTDWDIINGVENRIYKQGKFAILLGIDTLVTGVLRDFTLNIDYKNTSTPFDDEISGNSDYVAPKLYSNTQNMAIANALLADVGNLGLRLNFTSIQRAGQTEYRSGNVTGAYFDLQAGVIETGTMSLPNLGMDRNFCTGDSVLLDAGINKDKYLWNTGDTTRTIYVKSTGTYYVDLDSASMKGRSASVTLTASICTGIESVIENELLVYPNPSSGIFNLSKLVDSYCVYSSVGRILIVGGVTNAVDLSDQAQGIYVLKLTFAENVKTVRVVIQ